MKLSETLVELMVTIDQKIEKLLLTVINQQEEIELLKHRNKELESFYEKTIEQVEEYVNELEQIRNQHANRKHHIK